MLTTKVERIYRQKLESLRLISVQQSTQNFYLSKSEK